MGVLSEEGMIILLITSVGLGVYWLLTGMCGAAFGAFGVTAVILTMWWLEWR